MGNIKPVSFTIDKDNYDKVGPILKEVGLSRSRFVDLIFKALIDSNEKPMSIVQGDLFQDILHQAVTCKEKEIRGHRKKKAI